MSESPDTLAQQIAALEAALQLPLPEDTRQRLLADLRALRDQRALPNSAPGATNVSGTLRGNAVGVNYGTVQAFFGGAPGESGEQLCNRLSRFSDR